MIMGGNPFGVGSALMTWQLARPDGATSSGLRLSSRLRAPSARRAGDGPGRAARHDRARHGRATVSAPRNGRGQIAIARPNGQTGSTSRCCTTAPATRTRSCSTQDKPSHADTAFIHYGKDGFYFDQPGTYRLRARYTAPDGSIIVSPITTVRVRPPLDAEDEIVAELLFGEEQGTLMYLVGSDSDTLSSGNDALTKVREEHPEHRLADSPA